MFTASQLPRPGRSDWAIDLLFAEPDHGDGRVECVAVVLRSVPFHVVSSVIGGSAPGRSDPLAGREKPKPITTTLIRGTDRGFSGWAQLIDKEKRRRLKELDSHRAEIEEGKVAVSPEEKREATVWLRKLAAQYKVKRVQPASGKTRPTYEAMADIYNKHVRAGLMTPTRAVFEHFRPAYSGLTYRAVAKWVERGRKQKPNPFDEPPAKRRGQRPLRRRR